MAVVVAILGYQAPTETIAPPAIQHVVVPQPAVAPAPIVVEPPDPSLLGADTFARFTQDSWKAADKGGDYTLLGPNADFAVDSRSGTIRTGAGVTHAATLLGVRARDVDLRVRVQTDRAADGGDQFVFVILRRVDDTTQYFARVRLDQVQAAWLQDGRTVGTETEMLGDEVRVPDFTHGPGSGLWVRASATGDSPTTLHLKAWPDGELEPSDWQYTQTDSEIGLSDAGAVALQTYVSSRALNAPVTFSFSDLRVAVAAPEPLVLAPVVLPTATPEPTRVEPTPLPTATPTPTTDQIWAALQPRLEAAWGSDTPRTIAILDDFLTRAPDHPAAREKLYAALLSSAEDLTAAGDDDQAAEQLNRARDLFPDRAEAVEALTSLTPTPVPPPPEPVVVAPVQPPAAPAARAPAPAPRAPAPAPVRAPAPRPAPPVVQVAPPTPTKVPFVAPR